MQFAYSMYRERSYLVNKRAGQISDHISFQLLRFPVLYRSYEIIFVLNFYDGYDVKML